jgi:hypothetical protein
MILHESLYLEFITRRGVGANDVVASSTNSYISYLNSVAEFINSDITPKLLRSETDIANIELDLKANEPRRPLKTTAPLCASTWRWLRQKVCEPRRVGTLLCPRGNVMLN